MSTSVKLSKLITNYDLKNYTPNVDIADIRIAVPDINRPSIELTGYFEHFDANRVQIIGYVEESYIDQMSSEEKKKSAEALMSRRFPCLIFSRNMEPCEEFLEAAEKYGVPILGTEKATSAFMAEIIRWLNVQLAPCISIQPVTKTHMPSSPVITYGYCKKRIIKILRQLHTKQITCTHCNIYST